MAKKKFALGHNAENVKKLISGLRVKKLACSRSIFSRLLKISENTIERWESGKTKPKRDALTKIKMVNCLCDSISKTIKPQGIVTWLEKPNIALENFRPIDLFDSIRGIHKLKAFIEEIGLRINWPS